LWALHTDPYMHAAVTSLSVEEQNINECAFALQRRHHAADNNSMRLL
jgi:hypothetical protein